MAAAIDEAAGVSTLINTFHTSPGRQAAIVASQRRFTLETARRALSAQCAPAGKAGRVGG